MGHEVKNGIPRRFGVVGAAADVALSKLPAKAPEKAVMQAEGSGSQSGKVGGAKAKEKEKEKKRIMGRASAFGHLLALPRTRGLTTYKQIQEKERSHVKRSGKPKMKKRSARKLPRLQ